jgi:uncharacterized membrane protein HdeD (DUF308 family)
LAADTSIAVDVYIGRVLLFSGAAGLAIIFFAPNVPGFLWSLLTGALSLFAGVLLLWHPVESVVSLTLLLIAFFIAEGVFQMATALSPHALLNGSRVIVGQQHFRTQIQLVQRTSCDNGLIWCRELREFIKAADQFG